MTMKTNPAESRMLEQVRRWRREAYEAEKSSPEQDRVTRFRKLAGRFGLPTIEPERSHEPGRAHRHV